MDYTHQGINTRFPPHTSALSLPSKHLHLAFAASPGFDKAASAESLAFPPPKKNDPMVEHVREKRKREPHHLGQKLYLLCM